MLPKANCGKYIASSPETQRQSKATESTAVLTALQLQFVPGLDTAKGTKMVTIGEAFDFRGFAASFLQMFGRT